MKATASTPLSLIDVAGYEVVEWYAVYYRRTPYFFWAEWLKQGFRHVELWRPYVYGPEPTDVLWLLLKPTFAVLQATVLAGTDPPWVATPEDCTVQKVRVYYKNLSVREWFSFGPPTCVETVKNALGINSFWTRTPHQLYAYIKARHGVLGIE